jgi:hypothetical protein
MSALLFSHLERLPVPQQQVLLDFAEYLVRKYGAQPLPQKKKRKRRAGTLKGFLIYMADDFDAPLEDFNVYMQ